MEGGHVTRHSWETRRFGLDGSPGVEARSRDVTRHTLDEWFGRRGSSAHAAADDALLLVSELVTNACVHGGAPCELRLDHVGGRLWAQVSDHSTEVPRTHGRHRAARTSGHGLYLLQRLSAAWGWVPRGEGKTVWFEIPVPGAGELCPCSLRHVEADACGLNAHAP